jgi:galactosamine-6-phosphate isomerase
MRNDESRLRHRATSHRLVNTSQPFQVVRTADHEAMSRAAVECIAAQLRRKPDSLLILATGGTPERTYQLLAKRGRAETGLCDRLRILKLDEWGGLGMEDPATCEMALRRLLLAPLRIGPDRYMGWQSSPADTEAECCRMQQWFAENGPADLCILGLGLNGHLGFNEPGDYVHPGPHRAELARESKQHPMLHQAHGQPGYGLTLGLRDILQSREVLLLVSGKAKRSQLHRLFQPEISPQFPASFLWLHAAVTVCCDTAALPASPANCFRLASELSPSAVAIQSLH